MKEKTSSYLGVLSALLAGLMVLCSMYMLAQTVKQSSFYRQSRVIRLLLSQDSVGVSGLVSDQQNIRMLLHFAGALASAYINFELIPVNEANTFVVVLESLPDGIVIDKFEYRRRDLTIYGSASDWESYRLFQGELRDHGHFGNILVQRAYLATDDLVHFEFLCTAAGEADAQPDFA